MIHPQVTGGGKCMGLVMEIVEGGVRGVEEGIREVRKYMNLSIE